MVRASILGLVALCCVLALPSAARAQQGSGIAGVVRDSSGGVLPGVTVEAASPALIERVRTVATDTEGRFNIVELRVGTYTVTFTLAGFNTFKREGIQLTAGFTATVNADMQVGALEETITVTGAAPLVDTQNVRQQTTFSNELLNTLPTGNKGIVTFINLVPGLSGPADVGGTIGGHRSMVASYVSYHGRAQGKINVDGMGINNATQDGNSSYVLNAAIIEEMVLETGGINAESTASGFAFNAIPKEGSNSFRYSAAGRYTNSHLQSDNLSADLLNRGVTTKDSVEYIYDANFGVGGPIKRDRLWFFGQERFWGNRGNVGGVFKNKTIGTLFYTPDLNHPSQRYEYYRSGAARVTWQATSTNKLAFLADTQNNWVVQKIGYDSPETVSGWHFWPAGLYQVAWTRPATNRLLFEGGASTMQSAFPQTDIARRHGLDPYQDIAVRVLSTNFGYNGNSSYSLTMGEARERGYPGQGHVSDRYNERAAVSYVTGSHSVKVGFQVDHAVQSGRNVSNPRAVSYDFLNGVPNRITQRTLPFSIDKVKADLGVYAQDQWTIRRLTLNYGLRFEYFNGYVPAQHEPADQYVPERNFAAVHGVPSWKDVNPRVGVSYDLFGGGRTALKFSLGRYQDRFATGIVSQNNPMSRSITSVNRTWNDTNGNYNPDCNLTNFAANGECGAISNTNFGKANPNASRYSDEVLRGFAVRPSNWNVTAEVQHELLPRLSLTAGYYRNTSAHFMATDNEAVGPRDFDPFCITAPIDPRLPGGGGYQVCGLYDVKPASFGLVTNVVKPASDFGKQTRVSDFFGVSFNARLDSGLQLGGGLDTGRILSDNCFVVDSPQQLQNCHVVQSFSSTSQVKFNGSYPLPADFAVSGTFQNVPGPSYIATYQAPNSLIAPSLGRNLAACGTRAVCTSTATVPLIAPESQYESRRTQLDVRVTRSFTIGANARLRANLDVYNALNASNILIVNPNYGPDWRKPGEPGNSSGSASLDGRLVGISADLSF